MKRYHVISIAVLAGLIAGLSVSKAAEANTLICDHTVSQAPNLPPVVDAGALVVNTSKGKATAIIKGVSLTFPMKRVINKGWPVTDNKHVMYSGNLDFSQFEKGAKAELIIVVMKDDKENPLTIQYLSTDQEGETMVMGLGCTNN
ncbi:hypothetical protein DCH27_25325 [Salmonella enterica]|nr:hypothetical protein [Salmonella enterica]